MTLPQLANLRAWVHGDGVGVVSATAMVVCRLSSTMDKDYDADDWGADDMYGPAHAPLPAPGPRAYMG